jgi:putative transposase
VLWIRVIRVLLNRERWKVAKNLIYRLYKQEGLGLRKRPAGK